MTDKSEVNDFKYIDVHAHINFSEYDHDRNAVICEAKEKGIIIVNVGTDLESSKNVVALAEQYPNCYAIVGMHPTTANDEDFDYEAFKTLATHKKVIGIGECGLDFFREPYSIEKQERAFQEQIRLAIACGKPLMIHARNSYRNILSILDQYLSSGDVKLRGNVHFFAGTIEEAKRFIEIGFTVSFTGVITFAKEYGVLVKEIPLENILSETDCPFVTPEPFRGQRNSPLNIPLIIDKIAEIKGISPDHIAIQMKNNAVNLFGISF